MVASAITNKSAACESYGHVTEEDIALEHIPCEGSRGLCILCVPHSNNIRLGNNNAHGTQCRAKVERDRANDAPAQTDGQGGRSEQVVERGNGELHIFRRNTEWKEGDAEGAAK
jgi:hypothetical protein